MANTRQPVVETRKNKDSRTQSEILDHPGKIDSVYRKMASRLRNFVASRTSNSHETEDIVQNVFMSLSGLDLETEPVTQVTAWLFTAARNRITDYKRKKREKKYADYDTTDTEGQQFNRLLDKMTDAAADPEGAMFARTVSLRIAQALKKLPAEQRNVFELTEIEGFTHAQISESTGIPIGTVLSRKRYAVLALREELKDIYDLIEN